MLAKLICWLGQMFLAKREIIVFTIDYPIDSSARYHQESYKSYEPSQCLDTSRITIWIFLSSAKGFKFY